MQCVLIVFTLLLSWAPPPRFYLLPNLLQSSYLVLGCFCFVLFILQPTEFSSDTHILEDIEPSSGVWLTYQRP